MKNFLEWECWCTFTALQCITVKSNDHQALDGVSYPYNCWCLSVAMWPLSFSLSRSAAGRPRDQCSEEFPKLGILTNQKLRENQNRTFSKCTQIIVMSSALLERFLREPKRRIIFTCVGSTVRNEKAICSYPAQSTQNNAFPMGRYTSRFPETSPDFRPSSMRLTQTHIRMIPTRRPVDLQIRKRWKSVPYLAPSANLMSCRLIRKCVNNWSRSSRSSWSYERTFSLLEKSQETLFKKDSYWSW